MSHRDHSRSASNRLAAIALGSTGSIEGIDTDSTLHLSAAQRRQVRDLRRAFRSVSY